jgi:hypothetical protein
VDGFCVDLGIKHEVTAVYTPQQNGRVERLNRTLLDKTRAMMINSSAPLALWGEALMTAIRLRNLLTTAYDKTATPYEMFWGRKPNISGLRTFGCAAYVKVHKYARMKLDPMSRLGMLVGYALTSKAYRVLCEDEEGVLEIIESRDVSFDERRLEPLRICRDMIPEDELVLEDSGESVHASVPATSIGAASTAVEDPSEGNESATGDDEVGVSALPEDEGLGDGRSVRIRAPSSRLRDYARHLMTDEPTNLKEVKGRVDWPQWEEAMQSEINSLIENGTFLLRATAP